MTSPVAAASSATNPPSDLEDQYTNHADHLSQPQIPPSLKFLMSNFKNVISQSLTAENHAIWRSQVLKLFRANGFEGFLDGSSIPPSLILLTGTGIPQENPSYANWVLIDQNLAAGLSSVISPSILPYILSLDHCFEIWTTLDRRLQSSTRSRIIQLKNEMHFVSMKDKSMTHYLLEVKMKVDALAVAGAPLDVEDVIHYTLNGLPPTYQAFKTAIRTNLRSVSLDELYTLLCSEELNIAHESSIELQQIQIGGHQTALTAARGRGRGRSSYTHGKTFSQVQSNQTTTRGGKQNRPNKSVKFATNLVTQQSNAGIVTTINTTLNPPK